ncbi:site-specific integrase [Acidiphilium sp. JA12-A1]|uniref:tyrosine-type recombinase/integrase n=1 Tax=Acidiphilium sp. JA12-A1 TaxID=1464546 RepID=UPI0004612C3D|nr:site-specific integrase [Acidiphilium sp. JA12-A1]KDM66633.1 integrase family protein [Acidiphilium sp. JA12-A1]
MRLLFERGTTRLRAKIGSRVVEALKPGEIAWDTQVVGFGARRQGGRPSYVFKYRTKDGRQRVYTIGRHSSPWTPDEARAEAIRLLRIVVDGGDPRGDRKIEREAISVADLCTEYLADAEAGRILTQRREPNSASTVATDRCRIDAHIRPLIGHQPVASISRADIVRMMADIIGGKTHRRVKLDKPRAVSHVRGGRGAASRTMGLMGAIMTYAVRRGLRADNPCRLVIKPADGRRERRLDYAGYRALGAALDAAEAGDEWPPALAAIRYLAVTGWRRGEVLCLRWAEIDLARSTARLTATKTGASMRPLCKAGCAIITAMTPGEYVFRSMNADAPLANHRRVWERVVYRAAGLPRDVTPHVLRHTYASVAADLGLADATIGSLLGHRGYSVTRRYIHVADSALISAADTVAERIVAVMRGGWPACDSRPAS